MVITLSFIGLAGQPLGHHLLLFWIRRADLWSSSHHPFLLGTSRADLPSRGEGGWTRRGWVSFIINSLLMARFGGLVMENLEGLVEGGGHDHHPLLHRTSRADPLSHGEGV